MDNINKYAKIVSFDKKFAVIISGIAREDTQNISFYKMSFIKIVDKVCIAK